MSRVPGRSVCPCLALRASLWSWLLAAGPPALLTCPCLFQVPRIYWELSTKRVLLMEFVDGGQVNDRDYMERNKIDVNEVRFSAQGCCAWDMGVVGATH